MLLLFMPMELHSSGLLQVRLPPLVMISVLSVLPGPSRPRRATLANAAFVTMQGIASGILNLTKVTLLGVMPPDQLLLTFHKPLTSGLSAGFQVACAGGR